MPELSKLDLVGEYTEEKHWLTPGTGSQAHVDSVATEQREALHRTMKLRFSKDQPGKGSFETTQADEQENYSSKDYAPLWHVTGTGSDQDGTSAVDGYFCPSTSKCAVMHLLCCPATSTCCLKFTHG